MGSFAGSVWIKETDMTDIIFATHNDNKVREIRTLAGGMWNMISLNEAGLTEDIPEPHDTLEANAREKSCTIYKKTGKNCFSEDTGLEVKALNGAPGVLSARYAGPQKDSADNMRLLLKDMEGIEEREAQFRTVISLVFFGKEIQFEGICKGRITKTQHGAGGFGYDPVFIPEGSDKTFGEMAAEEKSRFSHRGKAFKKLVKYLSEIEKTNC